MRRFVLLFILFLTINISKSQILYPFLTSNGKWGFVNEDLEMVIKPIYDYAHPFIENVAAVEKNGVWGFIDKNGKAITKFEFIDLKETSEGLIPVCNSGRKWGYLNLEGEKAIAFEYLDAKPFNHGLAPVITNGAYGVIDKQGSRKIKPQYRAVTKFNEDGFAHAMISLREAYIIDTLGNKHEYLGATKYSMPREGIYQKVKNAKWGFYDLKTKNNIIPHEYDLVYHFNNGMAPVRKNGKWGFIDRNNNLVIDYRFDDASSFSEGLAAVKIGNKKGYINQDGVFIIKPQFSVAGDFNHGVAEVEKDGKYFYINKKGQLLKE